MATVPQAAWADQVDRRNDARRELYLGVTLRRAGANDIVPAEITNLSATGFLAETGDGVEVPALLDVDLPHRGSRAAQVVWTNGRMVGCSFTRPLTKPQISAAHLMGEPRQLEAERASASAARAIDPTDPIWAISSEAGPGEKWSLRKRLLVIGGISTMPWLAGAGLVALLA